jgi:hypothetical protein
MNLVHETVDQMGLYPWWTVTTDRRRTSPALSVRLHRAMGGHHGGGERERSQWAFLQKLKSAARDDG